MDGGDPGRGLDFLEGRFGVGVPEVVLDRVVEKTESCGVTLMIDRRLRCLSERASLPSTRTAPLSGSTKRKARRSSVDLPDPVGPTIASEVPPGALSETFFKTGEGKEGRRSGGPGGVDRGRNNAVPRESDVSELERAVASRRQIDRVGASTTVGTCAKQREEAVSVEHLLHDRPIERCRTN